MPTYSYACTSCDHRFDVQQGFSDEPLTECPQCSARLRKLFGKVGVVFKGSGFYRTDARADHRGSPGRKAAATEGTSKPGGSTGGTSSTPSGASGGSGSGAAAPATAGSKAAAD